MCDLLSDVVNYCCVNCNMGKFNMKCQCLSKKSSYWQAVTRIDNSEVNYFLGHLVNATVQIISCTVVLTFT